MIFVGGGAAQTWPNPHGGGVIFKIKNRRKTYIQNHNKYINPIFRDIFNL